MPPLLFAASGSGAQGMGSLLFFLLVMVAIFYLLVFRPQGQQKKKMQEMLSNLKTGDRVVTNGGILGTIVGFGSNSVVLQVASQVKIEVVRSAVSGLQKNGEAASGKKSEEPAEREGSVAAKGRK
jgi:preprotein translocase subunit YajC